MKRSYNEIEKKAQYFSEHRTKCKCGHTMLITSKDGKDICRWCHNYAFINEDAERKYRQEEFKKTLRRELNE